jgi:hypothetical protein
VLIWTAAGLHELTGAPPGTPFTFTIRRVFAVNEWVFPESLDFSAPLQTLTWTNNSISNPLLFYRLPPDNP